MAYDEAAVRANLAPHLKAAGFDLESLRITDAGPKSVIAVVVDSDAGPTLDGLAALSRTLSDSIDEADDVFGGRAFTLEVTTPGAERPLTSPRHWRRSQGRRAAIELVDGTSVVARIGALSDDETSVDVVVPGAKGAAPTLKTVPLADVRAASVQVEFKAPDARELSLSGLAAGRVPPGTPPVDVAETPAAGDED